MTTIKRSIDQYNIQTIHSAILAANTGVYENKIDWQPDFFVVVARLTAGYIWIYPGAQAGGTSFRMAASGQLVLPFHADVLTVQTVGATGFWDIYAVRNLDGFKVTS